MAGGNGRVLAAGDDPRRPTARLAKDVWVLGAGRAAPVIVAPPLPQVDLGSSVPTRAADALFWVGRAAERAEAIARTARVDRRRAGSRTRRWSSFDGGRWARRMALVLRVVARRGAATPSRRPAGRSLALDGELAAADAAPSPSGSARCSPRPRPSASTCRSRRAGCSATSPSRATS